MSVDALRLQSLAGRLRELAQPPLDDDWVPLAVGNHQVGLLRPTVARFVCERCGLTEADGGVRITPQAPAALSAQLVAIARKLHSSGLLNGWRDELLDVRIDAGSVPLATIERAACRPLGLTTVAVHLNAYRDDDTMVVAQRALHKTIDPGLWDNLVGGMVPAGEDLATALQREAWEEAGLRLGPGSAQHGRRFDVRRPVPEGLQRETIHVFDYVLPADAPLVNQDGEVARIEARSVDEVVAGIERGEFTLEAGLVVVESLLRRRSIRAPADLFH